MKGAHAAADFVASEAETCDGCERAYFGAGLYTNTHLVGVLLKERGHRDHGSTHVLLDVLGRDVFVFALRLVVAMEEKDDVAGKN